MTPIGPTLVCHCDGSSRGNPGPAGAGAVVLDSTGRERRVVSIFLGDATNNVAEYMALQEALKAAATVCHEDGLDPATVSVIVRTDSELVSRQVSGEYKVKSPGLGPLLREFRELAGQFYRVQVTYVPREENRRADELATRAADRRPMTYPRPRGGQRREGEVAPSGPSLPATGRPEAGSPTAASRDTVPPAAGGRGEPPAVAARRGSLRAGAARREGPPAAVTRYSRLSHLECSRCGGRLEPDQAHGACPSCEGPLLARYDLKGLVWPPQSGPAKSVGEAIPGPERGSMWRYHELLPVTRPECVISLGEGLTPLIPLPELGQRLGLARVLVKDERLNPTGTFKCRGASAAVSRLVELGVDRCAVPSAGNAGSAFAAYAARAKMRFLVAMPEDTPAMIQAEALAYGATVERVAGLLPDAARLVRERAKTEGWFVASTFDEPYRVEGKKTIAFEIFEALGGRWPEAIVFPVGGGVALIAAWKAMLELAEAGLTSATDDRARSGPKLFAVQAAGCAPVVTAFLEGWDETEPLARAETVAAGLRVPSPKAGFLILRAIRASGGAAVAVTDEEILETADQLRRTEGLNCCPEGAAAIAALPGMVRRGLLEDCSDIVVVNTGTGLKYMK